MQRLCQDRKKNKLSFLKTHLTLKMYFCNPGFFAFSHSILMFFQSKYFLRSFFFLLRDTRLYRLRVYTLKQKCCKSWEFIQSLYKVNFHKWLRALQKCYL